jgi:glycosyltransferase involved in cell wall biosynthesis
MAHRKNLRIGVASVLAWSKNSFNRDLCSLHRGFLSLGYTSLHIRPGSIDGTTVQGLVPTSLEQMQEPATWEELGCDLVITNTWGMPRYTPLIKAIKSSGAKVVIRMDSNGFNSPRCGYRHYASLTYGTELERGAPKWRALIKAGLKPILYYPSFVYDNRMLAHIDLGDLIGIESEGALHSFSKILSPKKNYSILNKLRIIRHPVVPDIAELEVRTRRENRIMCVGRWDSYFKNSPLMGRVLAITLKNQPGWTAEIYGPGSEYIEKEFRGVSKEVRSRLISKGPTPHADILTGWLNSKICLFTSSHEGSPIAGEEALCLGCSLVGPPDVPSMQDLAAPSFGTLAESRRPMDMAAAVGAEIARWEAGERVPLKIANRARSLFSAEVVCREILKNLNLWTLDGE